MPLKKLPIPLETRSPNSTRWIIRKMLSVPNSSWPRKIESPKIMVAKPADCTPSTATTRLTSPSKPASQATATSPR